MGVKVLPKLSLWYPLSHAHLMASPKEQVVRPHRPIPWIRRAVFVNDRTVPGEKDRAGHRVGADVDEQNAPQVRLNHARPQQAKEPAWLHRQAESATRVDVKSIEHLGHVRFGRG